MNPHDEQRLLQRCADNDRRAQNAAYEYYLPIITDTAVLFLHDRQLVNGCVSMAINKLFDVLTAGDIIDYPKAWLKKTATRICLDHLKKESTRMDLKAMLQENQHVEQGEWAQSYSDVIREKHNDIFWREIRSFAQRDQFIIFARYYYQFTYEKIAELMDVDVAFLHNRTNYVRRAIRKKFEG